MLLPFSLDFILAAVISLALLSSFVSVFLTISNNLREGISFAAMEERTLFKADFLLKTCYPEGIALCDGSFVYSHVADSRAVLDFPVSGEGFCVKRIVVQSGVLKVLRSCG